MKMHKVGGRKLKGVVTQYWRENLPMGSKREGDRPIRREREREGERERERERERQREMD